MNIRKLILVFLINFLYFCSPEIVNAQILFTDNFDDGNSDGWNIQRNTCSSSWLTNNNTYGIIISGGCVTETIPTSLFLSSSINYSFEVDVKMSQSINMDRNFVFKYKDSSNWYGIHTLNRDLFLQKVVNGTEYRLTNWNTTYNFEDNETYRFKIDVLSNSYKIYINGIYHTTVSDESPTFDNYSVGLQASAGGVTNSEVWFDNIVVTQILNGTPSPTPIESLSPSPSPDSTFTPTPSPSQTNTSSPSPSPTPTSTPTLPSLNVIDFKQYSGGWESEIYDHTSKTIKNWGCALTSAAMILQYHGHNVFPDVLNTWLNDQKDGYIGNGLINWLAVSRYTFLNKSSNSPALEYRRIDPTDANLVNELKNNRPAILKVPGHFIIAKSQTSDSFGINDPAYNNRFTLNSYSNTYLALNTYRPTFTNLSYLLLVLNYGNNLKVHDPSGNEILGYTFTEEPLDDDVDGVSKNGETLIIFQYPIPIVGVYRVEITGTNPPFILESYFYNQEGNLIGDEVVKTEGNMPVALNLNYDTDPDTSHVEILPATISNQKSTTPSTSSAIITWLTNRQSTSRVIYDTVSHQTLGSPPNYGYAYSTSTFDTNPNVLSHSLTILDLSADTVYYYRTISTGSPTAISNEETFRTLSIAGPANINNSTNLVNNSNKISTKVLGENTFKTLEKMEKLKDTDNNILGIETKKKKEYPTFSNFFRENKGSFISVFLLLTGICYLQIVKPITGKNVKKKL